MGPVARMGSVRILTIAAGDLFTLANSKIISEPVLDPLPKGNASTFPATLWVKSSCRGSLIRPFAGSTPPQKLMGCEVFRTSPLATPGTTQHPFIFLSTAISSCRFFPARPFQRRFRDFHRPYQGPSEKSNNWQTWRNRSLRR